MGEVLRMEKISNEHFLVLLRISKKEYSKVRKTKKVILLPCRGIFTEPFSPKVISELEKLDIHESIIIRTPRSRTFDVELKLIDFIQNLKGKKILWISTHMPYREFSKICEVREYAFGNPIRGKTFFISCVRNDINEYLPGYVYVGSPKNFTGLLMAIEKFQEELQKKPRRVIVVIDSWSKMLSELPPSAGERLASIINKFIEKELASCIAVYRYLEYREDAMHLLKPKTIISE